MPSERLDLCFPRYLSISSSGLLEPDDMLDVAAAVQLQVLRRELDSILTKSAGRGSPALFEASPDSNFQYKLDRPEFTPIASTQRG